MATKITIPGRFVSPSAIKSSDMGAWLTSKGYTMTSIMTSYQEWVVDVSDTLDQSAKDQLTADLLAALETTIVVEDA